MYTLISSLIMLTVYAIIAMTTEVTIVQLLSAYGTCVITGFVFGLVTGATKLIKWTTLEGTVKGIRLGYAIEVTIFTWFAGPWGATVALIAIAIQEYRLRHLPPIAAFA